MFWSERVRILLLKAHVFVLEKNLKYLNNEIVLLMFISEYPKEFDMICEFNGVCTESYRKLLISKLFVSNQLKRKNQSVVFTKNLVESIHRASLKNKCHVTLMNLVDIIMNTLYIQLLTCTGRMVVPRKKFIESETHVSTLDVC